VSAPIRTPLDYCDAVALAVEHNVCPCSSCECSDGVAKFALAVDAASRTQALEVYAMAPMVRALRAIREGEGAFSRDNYEFACNVIDRSKALASEALALVERLLCSPTCAQRYGHPGPHDGEDEATWREAEARRIGLTVPEPVEEL
jgi:hypothetical protein